jgi:hypothetical protein
MNSKLIFSSISFIGLAPGNNTKRFPRYCFANRCVCRINRVEEILLEEYFSEFEERKEEKGKLKI